MPAGGFFQAGRAYADGVPGPPPQILPPTRFLCVAVSVHPDFGSTVAFGWVDKIGGVWRGTRLTNRDWLTRDWIQIDPPPEAAPWAGVPG